MDNEFFSIKMRASKDDKHLSGAERIVKKVDIERTINELYKRGSLKNPDNISIKIEKIDSEIVFIEKTLKIKDLEFENFQHANEKAVFLISKETGIKKEIVNYYVNLIHTGASLYKQNMRGAMIVDTEGNRIEIDKNRGVRTVFVDYVNRKEILKKLFNKNYTERTADALALTTKNLNYKDMIAEYCISDEPDYTTGYVSIKGTYYRFSPLKKEGNNKGGRIYFVKKGIDLEDFYNYLQKIPILIKDVNLEDSFSLP
jgi:6-carboxyhexanoate--CoA ligase